MISLVLYSNRTYLRVDDLLRSFVLTVDIDESKRWQEKEKENGEFKTDHAFCHIPIRLCASSIRAQRTR